MHKRLYTISHSIGCFDLNRFKDGYPSMKRLLGFHWEYFASFSPLWKGRLKHIAERNSDHLLMEFKNDDLLEDFGEKYNYEPDEQSSETQEKSIIEIKPLSPSVWIDHIFGVEYRRKKKLPIYFV